MKNQKEDALHDRHTAADTPSKKPTSEDSQILTPPKMAATSRTRMTNEMEEELVESSQKTTRVSERRRLDKGMDFSVYFEDYDYQSEEEENKKKRKLTVLNIGV